MNKIETGEQKKGLVTVIVPCYNYARFLPEALDSILQQEYENWECIIVNDGSTDNTEEVATVYTKKDSRFKYIYQSNKGLPASRNTGIKHSKGEFLQFLDSDDMIHASKLRIQTDLMHSNTGADIVYGDSLFFSGEGADKLLTVQRKRSKAKELLLVNNIMAVSCALVRKSILEHCGLFDETYSSYEDWHFWIMCALNGCHFYYAPLAGTETYIRYGHTSMLTNRKKLTANAIQLRKFFAPHLNRKQKFYNNYRLTKLYIRRLFAIY